MFHVEFEYLVSDKIRRHTLKGFDMSVCDDNRRQVIDFDVYGTQIKIIDFSEQFFSRKCGPNEKDYHILKNMTVNKS